VLEREKRQILHAPVFLQIIDEAPQPRGPALRIRPHFDVFIHAFKHWPAELQFGINAMQRRRPLQVQRSVIFRRSVFSIRFFADFHIRNRVTALGRGIFPPRRKR